MPPVEYVSCGPPDVLSTTSPNGTTAAVRGTEQSDLQALLYIVITLLFYSLGIIIGIISYLKREKREMQEDKTYDDFFTMKLDPFVAVKSQRVQQFAERIKYFEERKRQREEEAERLKALSLTEPSGSGEGHPRRISKISLLPPDSFSMHFLSKGCQTDDLEKESSSLGKKARKIVKILTPTPSRNPKTSKMHIPRPYKKKEKPKDVSIGDHSLSSPTLTDDDRLSVVSVDNARQRSPSLLTPTICLPPEDTESRSSMSDSPQSVRRLRSPVPYIDASTDDDVNTDRPTSPLINDVVLC